MTVHYVSFGSAANQNINHNNTIDHLKILLDYRNLSTGILNKVSCNLEADVDYHALQRLIELESYISQEILEIIDIIEDS